MQMDWRFQYKKKWNLKITRRNLGEFIYNVGMRKVFLAKTQNPEAQRENTGNFYIKILYLKKTYLEKKAICNVKRQKTN